MDSLVFDNANSLQCPTSYELARRLVQAAEPPYTDPYVRWCDRENPRGSTYVDHFTLSSPPQAVGHSECSRKSIIYL